MYLFTSFLSAVDVSHWPTSARSREQENSNGTLRQHQAQDTQKDKEMWLDLGGQNRIFNTHAKTEQLALKENKARSTFEDLYL